jgi:predicted DNA-binding transcriptional regulator AlpA
MSRRSESMAREYLSRASLAHALDIAESTVDEMVRRGVLPPPIRLSPGCVRWCWADVEVARRNRQSVYFIECGDYIKIGFSASLKRRLAALENVTPYPLILLATINGSKEIEADLHSRFADARHKGEWFRKTPELMSFIAECTAPKALAA